MKNAANKGPNHAAGDRLWPDMQEEPVACLSRHLGPCGTANSVPGEVVLGSASGPTSRGLPQFCSVQADMIP